MIPNNYDETKNMTKREKLYLVAFVIILILGIAYFLRTPRNTNVLPSTNTEENSTVDNVDTNLNNQPQLEENQFANTEVDLNGDGPIEKISLPSPAKLQINNQATTVPYVYDVGTTRVTEVSPQSPDGFFGIVDLDLNDKQKEVVVTDGGPSSDYITSFYTWNGTQIVKIGVIPGSYGQMKFNGTGTVTTQTRARVLDTWFYKDDFKLVNNTLTHIPKDLYLRNSTNTVYVELPLVRSPKDPTVVTTTSKNEVITIIGCDNIAWCKIKTSKGIEGWFEIENYNFIKSIGMHAGQGVFDNLSSAD